MSDDENTPAPAKKANPLDGAFIEILERLANEASVSMATLRLAIHEQSYEKNLSRRRIGKVIEAFGFDPKDLRKRLIAHDKKHGKL